jgi:hypothetical protein
MDHCTCLEVRRADPKRDAAAYGENGLSTRTGILSEFHRPARRRGKPRDDLLVKRGAA